MRERFKYNTTKEVESVYVYKNEDWVYCPFCASRYGRQKKLLKVVERKGSILIIECRFCKEHIEVTV